MYFYFFPVIASYNFILIAAAVIPAVFLMAKVYRSDMLEKESHSMLVSLVLLGVVSALTAAAAERILCAVLDRALPRGSMWYDVILYFGIVAFAEEGSKFFFLKRRTWSSAEFDCQFDGVVYAVFVSLGFALAENIGYVLAYGFRTAVIRALTAIPGHACFGVFMGAFYALAKKSSRRGSGSSSSVFRVLALILPALLHGAYDYVAVSAASERHFIALIALLFAAAYILTGRMASKDRYI